MKNLVSVLILILSGHHLSSQIVITEINYNPPESGQDSLEYIEIFNQTSSNISLKDWVIDDAINIVFPDTFINSNSYLVLCVNQAAFESVYGFKAIQWDAGALRNDSELITLKDQNGTVVDSVRYSDSNGWPAGPDGNGPSLELCRVSANNEQPEYWKASLTKVGIIINNYDVRGTPGKANNVPCADVTIDVRDFSFNPANLEILVGQHIEWKNSSGKHNVDGLKNVYPNNPDEFYSGPPATGNWTYIKRFDIEGDYNYRDDANPNTMTGKIKVKKVDPLYPQYPIGLVTSVKTDGTLDSNNVRCTLEGIVYGINFRPAGLQFTIIDALNDGISVFHTNKNFGYIVQEGDKVRVKGTITLFNGLAEIVPDTIQLIGTGNLLSPAQTVTSLNENTESQLVKLKNVYLQSPVQWTKNPLGFTVKVTDGINVYDVRIDNDCDLVSKEAPAGKFDLTGIGSQNDNITPYLDGYQLWPRYTTDINPYLPQNKYYNKLDIGKVRTIKANGELDSLKVRCELRGIVYGIDFDGGNSLQFTLRDLTGGITVFHNQKSFNYKVTQGDEIIVQGIVDQFNGQAEIIPDTIVLVSEKNAIKTARTVSRLDESTESDLVRLQNVSIVDITDWIGNGTSFNVRVTDGLSEFLIRIDNDCALSKTTAKGKLINVTGIGNQFDNELPYTEGYQLWPRFLEDIDFLSSSHDIENIHVRLLPNPAHDRVRIVTDSESQGEIDIYTLDGKSVAHYSAGHTELELHLEPGLYVVRIKAVDGFYYMKLMIE
ncbi:MAG: lamin tail domain-containing protein [Saprospiraceae bacterium]|nr:lamin tail domain-containing protein [Saprospiraceae bacterium]HMW40203.1 lamin tail domain-containing protein [Saprospiraceae bacterium]HMX88822.1 lamin tail domain-containing protein [Saprospiraceae bacterium]HMZ39106.1 lamin tail domain-containing protein [Saprospiraceae bacterium]HNA65269.1 lamin tail domain-containing protein [Saprospiraceae bacterium]